ncbi:MAG: signal peptidase I [Oscillospiraceae bacterium]|nr:signal peptidase I [Oscillospiraceae bacterium]
MAEKSKQIRKNRTPEAVIRRRLEDARFHSELIQFIQRMIIIALAAWIFLTKVFIITQAHGQNMFPSVKDGDLIIAFRLQTKYQKDDIVFCTVDGQSFIGRIAAKENDVINMDQTGALYVNGTRQTGEIIFLTMAKPGIEYPYRVPDGHVFLLGDYRSAAVDSRDFGPVSKKDVKGKVITILRRRQL